MHNQILLEQPQSKETFINDIQKVSREDIVTVAEKHFRYNLCVDKRRDK